MLVASVNSGWCYNDRLLGLTALVLMDCSFVPWGMKLNTEATWPMYVNPAFIYMLYYVAVVSYIDISKKVMYTCMAYFI